MEIELEYDGLEDRQIKVKEQEALGLRMLHDNFHATWKPGDEPHGVMIFTDEPAPVEPVEPTRDLAKEIDEIKDILVNLKARIEKLEGGLSAIRREVSAQREHCAGVTSGFEQRISGLEKTTGEAKSG